MRVSAIMPTYNQDLYLESAIASVVNQVDELVVVDDGSTDRTKEILEKLSGHDNMKVITREENRGTARTINEGFDATDPQNQLVTWVSSDNVHTRRWAEGLKREFEDPEVGVAYSTYDWGGRRIVSEPYSRTKLISTVNCYFGPSFMIRRDVWERTGPHRGKISHDYDHWLRVEEVCWEGNRKIVHVPQPLCIYRVHDQRVTVTRRHEFDAKHWQEEARKRRAVK